MKSLMLILILWVQVFAAETAQPPPSQPPEEEGGASAEPTVTTHNLKVSGIGDVTVTVTDNPNPEPIDIPVSIEATLKCIGSTLDRKVNPRPLKGCDFESVTYDKATLQLVVKYKRNVFDDNSGVLTCKAPAQFRQRLNCNTP